LHFQCFGYDELTVKKATQRKNFSQVHPWERNERRRWGFVSCVHQDRPVAELDHLGFVARGDERLAHVPRVTSVVLQDGGKGRGRARAWWRNVPQRAAVCSSEAHAPASDFCRGASVGNRERVADTPNSADGNLSVNITLRASTLTTSLFVVLTTQAPGRFSDNVMLIEAGQSVLVEFMSWDGPLNSTGMDLLKGSLGVEHLAENM
jgi:hypothetical protein